jgi:ribonuclease P protein component
MLRLYAAVNDLDVPRFGVSVSKTCGSAAVRNRLKRFGREAFRLHQHEIPPNFDYILIITEKKPKKAEKNNKISKESHPVMRFQDFESAFLTMIQALSRKMAR